MQKEILEIVNDFTSWRGNSFTLAIMVATLVKERCAERSDALGATEVSEAIRGL